MLLRDNYIARTLQTVPGIMESMKSALKDYDLDSFAGLAPSLFDEAGEGKSGKVHLKLMVDSFNTLGNRVFGLPPVSLMEVAKSSYLTEETLNYVDFQKKTLRHTRPYQVAVNSSKEHKADAMLLGIKIIFDKYKGYFTPEEYRAKVMPYFLAHNDPDKKGGDVEIQHGLQLREIVTQIFMTSPSPSRVFRVMEKAGMDNLNLEAKSFESVSNEILKMSAAKSGQPVLPREEFLSKTLFDSKIWEDLKEIRGLTEAKKKAEPDTLSVSKVEETSSDIPSVKIVPSSAEKISGKDKGKAI